MRWFKVNTDLTDSALTNATYNVGKDSNVVGNLLKTSYNKLTGYTKVDNRPASGTSAGSYALQVRGYHRDTSGQFTGVDCEADLYTTGTGSVCGIQGVAKVRSGITATGSTLIGAYGQARVDGDMDGSSYVSAIYGVLGASSALTATHFNALWLDTHQDNVITGHYELIYLTENGTEPLDTVIYLRTPGAASFIEFLDCDEFVGNGAKSGGTAKNIKVVIDGVTHYINAWPS